MCTSHLLVMMRGKKKSLRTIMLRSHYRRKSYIVIYGCKTTACHAVRLSEKWNEVILQSYYDSCSNSLNPALRSHYELWMQKFLRLIECCRVLFRGFFLRAMFSSYLFGCILTAYLFRGLKSVAANGCSHCTVFAQACVLISDPCAIKCIARHFSATGFADTWLMGHWIK